MNKLDLAINEVKRLPTADQEIIAELLVRVATPNAPYVLSDEEVTEVERRLATDKERVAMAEAFKDL